MLIAGLAITWYLAIGVGAHLAVRRLIHPRMTPDQKEKIDWTGSIGFILMWWVMFVDDEPGGPHDD